MPERVYMNRRTGEERIHIEISRAEISEMLARPTAPATRRFWELLAEAENQFDAGLRDMARQAGTPETPCPAGLLPLGSKAVEPCLTQGPHTMHRSASGESWTNAEVDEP